MIPFPCPPFSEDEGGGADWAAEDYRELWVSVMRVDVEASETEAKAEARASASGATVEEKVAYAAPNL